MNQIASLAPAERLAYIIENLCQVIGRRSDWRLGLACLPGQLLFQIWKRLRGIAFRFRARLARNAANPVPIPARLRKQHPARPGAARPGAARPRKPDPLPRHYAWLLRLIQETAHGRSQFCDFLADPEMATLLTQDPQLRSILRPLCHILGIRRDQVPSLYPPKPPAPPLPSQPPDPQPAEPPIHPIIAPEQAEQAASPPGTAPPPDPEPPDPATDTCA